MPNLVLIIFITKNDKPVVSVEIGNQYFDTMYCIIFESKSKIFFYFHEVYIYISFAADGGIKS